MKLIGVLLLSVMLPAVQDKDTAMNRAGFIVGCWERSAASTVRETWRMASDDFLIGTATTVAGGVVREFEFLRIESKNGVVDYVAQPNGVPPTRFTLDPSSKAGEAIFVNMQHDFPKRVVYRRTADGVLAFIDGGAGVKTIEFPMKKVSCS